MDNKNFIDVINPDILEEVVEDLIKIFGSNKDKITKKECRIILNIIFEALFDEKLKTKNFNYIFNLISKDDNINKEDMEPLVRAFIVCFDVNFITNSNSFNDKVCIKIGKHLLPTTYYIKKNSD